MSVRCSTNGNNLLLTLGTSLTIGTGDFSYGCLVKRVANAASWCNIVTLSTAVGAFPALGLLFYTDFTSLFAVYSDGGSSFLQTGNIATTTGQWYWMVQSRSGSTGRLRLFDMSGTKVNELTYTDAATYTGIDTIQIGWSSGYTSNGFNGEAANLKIHTGVAWSDAECVTEMQTFGVQKTGGTDTYCFGLETLQALRFGLVDWHAGTATLANTGAVNGASRPASLEAANVYYVNVASSAGGTGLTNATSGTHRAFHSLDDALTATAQDLTGVVCTILDDDGAATVALSILCAGSTVDSSAATMNAAGWATDTTHRILIEGDHTGGAKWDASKYRLAGDAGYGVGTLDVGKAVHLNLKNLQLEGTGALNNAPCALRLGNFAWDVRMENLVARLTGGGGGWDGAMVVRHNADTALYTLKVRNTLLMAADGHGLYYTGYNTNTGSSVLLYNVTAINRSATGRSGILIGGVSGVTERCKNILVQGPGTTNYTVGDTPNEQATILTQDASSPTTALRNKTLTFVDAANWDYHLAAGDTNAIGAGTDLSADAYWPFSTDADGQTRSAPWDVGADEYSGEPPDYTRSPYDDLQGWRDHSGSPTSRARAPRLIRGF